MRQIVESLKRLFLNNKLEREKIEDLYKSGKISLNERKYILGLN